MKITLLRPMIESGLNLECVGIQPPMGLGYLSSFLKANDYNIEIIDGFNGNLGNEILVEKSKDADLVGINCLTILYNSVVDLSIRLKKAGKTVILGGPHASNSPEKTLAETGADYLSVGEGEELLLEVARAIESGRNPSDIYGLYTKSSGVPVRRNCPASLDDLPFPDWAQMAPQKYKIPSYRDRFSDRNIIRPGRIAPVLTSRGCKMGCAGCDIAAQGMPVRYRTAGNIVDELEYLKENHGVEEFHFEDVNITSSRAHFEGICQEMLRRGFKTEWGMSSEVNTSVMEAELIRLAAKAGCIYMGFQIGSADPEMLRAYYSNVDLYQVVTAMEAAHRAGIMIAGCINMVIEKESPESVKNTVEFLAGLPLKRANINLLGSREEPGAYYSVETLVKKLENDIGKKMWLSFEVIDKSDAYLYEFDICGACKRSSFSNVNENMNSADEWNYYMTGEINFSDGTKPELFIPGENGEDAYIYSNLEYNFIHL
ncbi:MAG: B12-binding domain-containing radical SAM protein, partial [Firmicutes bacterium]|nr:B12-binding domain-containing radical SAM protein [Bacillota bacterium]